LDEHTCCSVASSSGGGSTPASTLLHHDAIAEATRSLEGSQTEVSRSTAGTGGASWEWSSNLLCASWGWGCFSVRRDLASDEVGAGTRSIDLHRDLSWPVLPTGAEVSFVIIFESDVTDPLKFWMLTLKAPEASAVTGVDEPMPVRAAFPHGLLADGRCTSLRAAVPFTPRAGLIAAWADTSSVEKARMAPDRRIDLKSILKDVWRSDVTKERIFE
jgi:hypothetical protein